MAREAMRRCVVAVILLLLLAGVCLQQRWDAQCDAQEPGTHWNGDDWRCEGARR